MSFKILFIIIYYNFIIFIVLQLSIFYSNCNICKLFSAYGNLVEIFGNFHFHEKYFHFPPFTNLMTNT